MTKTSVAATTVPKDIGHDIHYHGKLYHSTSKANKLSILKNGFHTHKRTTIDPVDNKSTFPSHYPWFGTNKKLTKGYGSHMVEVEIRHPLRLLHLKTFGANKSAIAWAKREGYHGVIQPHPDYPKEGVNFKHGAEVTIFYPKKHLRILLT